MIPVIAVHLALLTSPAHAWGCFDKPSCTSTSGCIKQPGTSSTYQINVNDFTSAEIDEIDAGASAWNAGSGELVRGAVWSWNRGADLTVDGTKGDGVNNVRMKGQYWFDLMGIGGVAAVNYNMWDVCDIFENDVTFNSSETWFTDPYSVTTGPGKSIGQVTVHELGHALGFTHEFDVPASMSYQPNGGDFAGERYRINEDDYVALSTTYPGSSTGMNLMLGRWVQAAGASEVAEVWSDDEHMEDLQDWDADPGDSIAVADGPRSLLGVWVGTGGGGYVDIRWYLSTNASCPTASAPTLATRTMLFSVDSAAVVTPTSSYDIPAWTPAHRYYLCAHIDYHDDHAETEEDNNIVVSEKLFEVH